MGSTYTASQVREAGVSVIICCYNSKDVLKETLEHMAAQEVPADVDWEVILIDNASTDGTGEIAQEIWEKQNSDVEFRVVLETNPGLSFARKQGVYSAKYPILVFCDDDNWFDTDYVARAYKLMMDNPETSIAGGLGVGVTDGEFPEWFDRYQTSYACGPARDGIGFVKHHISGAGIIQRRATLLKAYELGFDTVLTGRKGKSLTAGEDSELAEWIAMFESDQWFYDPGLKFKHFIKQSRLSFPHLLKLQAGFGKAAPVLQLYNLSRKGKLNGFRLTWLRSFMFHSAIFMISLVKSISNRNFRICFTRGWASLAWLLANYSSFCKARTGIIRMDQIRLEQLKETESDDG